MGLFWGHTLTSLQFWGHTRPGLGIIPGGVGGPCALPGLSLMVTSGDPSSVSPQLYSAPRTLTCSPALPTNTTDTLQIRSRGSDDRLKLPPARPARLRGQCGVLGTLKGSKWTQEPPSWGWKDRPPAALRAPLGAQHHHSLNRAGTGLQGPPGVAPQGVAPRVPVYFLVWPQGPMPCWVWPPNKG